MADHVAQGVKTTIGSSLGMMSELKQETTEYILNIAIFINYKDSNLQALKEDSSEG